MITFMFLLFYSKMQIQLSIFFHVGLYIFFKLQDYDAQDLLDFEETILRGVDYNQDGKINRKELTMILLALAKHNQEEESSS